MCQTSTNVSLLSFLSYLYTWPSISFSKQDFLKKQACIYKNIYQKYNYMRYITDNENLEMMNKYYIG